MKLFAIAAVIWVAYRVLAGIVKMLRDGKSTINARLIMMIFVTLFASITLVVILATSK